MNRDERIAVVMGSLAQAWHLTSPSDRCGTVMVKQAVAAVDNEWPEPPAPQRPMIDPKRLNVLQEVLDEWFAGQRMVSAASFNQLRGAQELYMDMSKLIEELRK